VPVLLSQRIIQQVLPLHESEDLSYLRDNWVQAFFHTQPLGELQPLVFEHRSIYTYVKLSMGAKYLSFFNICGIRILVITIYLQD